MTNQLLFGESFTILQISDNQKWLQIQNIHDQYEGWIDSLQARPVSENFISKYIGESNPSFLQKDYIINLADKSLLLTKGSRLPFYDKATQQGEIDGTVYQVSSDAVNCYWDTSQEQVLAQALHYLHTPYLWGGRSLWGIDCSGFTQQVFKMVGYQLPRDAYQQVENGKLVQDLSKAEPADLAFFEREGRIVHVGIVVGSQKIIHARGCVRIDRLDEKGIYDEESNTYSHELKCIKRVL